MQGYVVAVAVVASTCVWLMGDAAGMELQALHDLDEMSQARDTAASRPP